MIIIGIGQLLAAIMLVFSGGILAAKMPDDYLIYGILQAAAGIYLAYTSIIRRDPPGV